MQIVAEKEYPAFAAQCRTLLASGLSPADLCWSDPYGNAGGEDLFEAAASSTPLVPPLSPTGPAAPPRVPADFVKLASEVFCHSDSQRFSFIYEALWRLTHGERQLLEKITDEVIFRMMALRKQVTRDAHKMKAFVRFRKVEQNGIDWYVAWHSPDHHVLRHVAPFFRDRFRPMQWTIMTPDESLSWDGNKLRYSEGVARDPISGDVLEELWQTYYASTFNPARANVSVMKTHMPVRYWQSMPETKLIPELVNASADRTSAMLTSVGATAMDFLPEELSIDNLRLAAKACRGCPLYHNNHHAVCSEGPANARLALVGEQPGDHEDMAGRPFVGPSGEVLNRALAEAGVPREAVYITESIKHFKHEIVGKRRIHRSPNGGDIAACRPWLVAEMHTLRPAAIVCLGATAAQSVLGKKVALRDVRNRIHATALCEQVIITSHPAAVLRQPEKTAADQVYQDLVNDLRRGWELSGGS